MSNKKWRPIWEYLYLRQGGYKITCVYLCICLSVFKISKRIFMKIGTHANLDPRKKRLNVSGYPNQVLDPGSRRKFQFTFWRRSEISDCSSCVLLHPNKTMFKIVFLPFRTILRHFSSMMFLLEMFRLVFLVMVPSPSSYQY